MSCLQITNVCDKKVGSATGQKRVTQKLKERTGMQSLPHTHLGRSHILEPNRSPIAIVSRWFDSFKNKFLHGMTFNHWEPNLSWIALNLFTSIGSSRKVKSAILLSKIGSAQFFWISFSGAISIFPISNHRLSASS